MPKIDYTKPQIWDTIWNRPYHNYEKHHQVFWDEIRTRAQGRVADLACGSASCWRMPHPFNIVDLTGFDFSPAAIKEAKENCPWGHFQVADITKTGATSEIYDTTILCGVVNYYPKLDKIMKEASRITKPGGDILITINVIDDFPGRHWGIKRINQEFKPYGSVFMFFVKKVGWFVAIKKK